jgi:sugar O-acyltransferase (sialic acid O-acetyltransferase NeuD family)
MNAQSPRFSMLGFVDDDPAKVAASVGGYPLLGSLAWLERHARDAAIFVGVGSCPLRARIARSLGSSGRRAAVLVHPSATVCSDARLDEGAMIAAGAVISTNVRIGRHSHVNIGASVSHDCQLADFVHVAPGARLAGNVSVGSGSDVGLGALLLQGTTVGEWTIVGAGTVVLRDVPSNVTVVGAPSRVVKTRLSGWEEA